MRLVTAQFSSTAQEELGIRSVFYGPVKAHYSFLSSRSAATGAVNGCRCEAAEVVKASVVKKKKKMWGGEENVPGKERQGSEKGRRVTGPALLPFSLTFTGPSQKATFLTKPEGFLTLLDICCLSGQSFITNPVFFLPPPTVAAGASLCQTCNNTCLTLPARRVLRSGPISGCMR